MMSWMRVSSMVMMVMMRCVVSEKIRMRERIRLEANRIERVRHAVLRRLLMVVMMVIRMDVVVMVMMRGMIRLGSFISSLLMFWRFSAVKSFFIVVS